MKNKIAVVSDIHSNADALVKVLDELTAKPTDLTIFLGDILTYGMQPLAVLDLLKSYSKSHKSVFIKGNHDQLYFDIQGRQNELNYKMPPFVEESFLWTLNKIDGVMLESLFNWHEEYLVGDIYFSHANPFKFGDWRYLEDNATLDAAFDELAKKQCRIGVFGHSHRQLISANRKRDQICVNYDKFQIKGSCSYIVNSGSAGQPRGKGLCYLTFEIDKECVYGELHPFHCDIGNMSSMILSSDFAEKTKYKLIEYLRS
jgi:predicted phosphodiesterase